MHFTRRELGKLVLVGSPVAIALSNSSFAQSTGARPNSKWAGVQVGMNVPYNFKTGNFMSVDEVIARSVKLNLSGMELRAQPIELALGSPAAMEGAASAAARGRGAAAGQPAARGTATAPGNAEAGAAPRGGGGRAEPTPAQQAAQRAASEATRKWRMGVSLDRVRDIKRKFDTAGVATEIIKWDGLNTMADDEIDYCFQVSKAMGAKALSAELNLDLSARVGKFADKHQMMFGYHGHMQSAAQFEQCMAQAKFNAINVDLGHYTANHGSPVEFVKKYHSRISHVHVKDRKLNAGPNMPFGQGDTPIREVLRLMRDNKWGFQATIEFEYPVPDGSTLDAELAKTLAFCRDCLLS